MKVETLLRVKQSTQKWMAVKKRFIISQKMSTYGKRMRNQYEEEEIN